MTQSTHSLPLWQTGELPLNEEVIGFGYVSRQNGDARQADPAMISVARMTRVQAADGRFAIRIAETHGYVQFAGDAKDKRILCWSPLPDAHAIERASAIKPSK